MLAVRIKKAQFYAFHGLYPEEKKCGNHFEVDLEVTLDTSKLRNTLDASVNYVMLYERIEMEMRKQYDLLEELAEKIARPILADFDDVDTVSITICKLDPPLGGRVEASEIALSLSR